MIMRKNGFVKPMTSWKRLRKTNEIRKDIGVKFKKKKSSPQLWETSRKEHEKKARNFFGI